MSSQWVVALRAFQQAGPRDQPGAGLDAATGARRARSAAQAGKQRRRGIVLRAEAGDDDEQSVGFGGIEAAADRHRQAASRDRRLAGRPRPV